MDACVFFIVPLVKELVILEQLPETKLTSDVGPLEPDTFLLLNSIFPIKYELLTSPFVLIPAITGHSLLKLELLIILAFT